MAGGKRRQGGGDTLSALFAVTHKEALDARSRSAWGLVAARLKSELMPVQRVLEQDPSRRIAVRSPRQTGKSTGVMLITTIRCLEREGAEWVIIGLTRGSVKNVYWKALKQLNVKYELKLTFQNQELIATFPNGSAIRFVGADNMAEIEKLRGGRYDGVVIDECKSYPLAVFKELVHDVLEPALMAKNGQLFLIGTPGSTLKGPFFEATAETPIAITDEYGKVIGYHAWPYGRPCPDVDIIWSLHQWTLRDNTTQFPDGKGGTYRMWDKALEIKRRNRWSDDNPTWRREYLGHWVPEDHLRVYRFNPGVHCYKPFSDTKWGVPEAVGGYRTVICVDLGTRDGTGIVIWGWNPHSRDLWELYSGKKRAAKGERLPIRELAAWWKELEQEYGPFDGWPSDSGGLATMVYDTLADEYEVYLEPADKHEKDDHIELFNNDLDACLIHVREGSELAEELEAGRWDPKKLDKGKKFEDPRIPNDVADAGLYGFRWCNHRRSIPAPSPNAPFGSPLWIRWQEDQHFEALRNKTKAKLDEASSGRNLDREWWHDSYNDSRFQGN